MCKGTIKRAISLLLCVVLLPAVFPVVSFAAETDGLCEHHTEHLECGFVEGESDCDFVCELCMQATEETTEPEAVEEATEPEAAEETVEPDETIIMDTVEAGAGVQAAPEADLPENDELFAYFAERELYGYDFAAYGVAARQMLNTAEQAIYDVLKAKIEKVATNGGSTKFVVSEISGLKTVWTNTELGVTSIDDTAMVDTAFADQFDLNDIMSALLNDCPLDLYWYDKIAGVSMAYKVDLSGYDDGVQIVWETASIADLTFTFAVSADYKAGKNVVTTDVSKVATAKSNAAKVVANNAGKSDYEKLVAYKDYICAAVSYNQTSADDNTTPYGDPWQLISVFDGDSSTNVVCEGYSKAFQYLCDLTNFAGDTTCYSVTGWMDGGNHMWNIVTLDGSNYLADVTNSDSGTIGASGGLFLDGAYGSVNGGYWVAGCSYQYDSETLSLWGTDADSILKLSNTSYSAEDEEPVAVSGVCGDNLTWTLDNEGMLTISGTGEMWDFIIAEAENCPKISTPWGLSITSAVIEPGVTSIGDGAFCKSGLTNIEIPNSVTNIGHWAFSSCNNLTNINIPDNVTSIGDHAFNCCYNLTSIIIPDGVTNLGNRAFSCCYLLENIELGASVTSIGEAAFYDCDSLTNIKIPDSVITIGKNAFRMCDELTSVVLGSGVTDIGESAFFDCQNLTSINIPDSMISIGNYALSESGITSIEIPDGVTSIGDYAFHKCSNLTSIALPNSVTTIGKNAFAFCTSLTSIEIPDGVISLNGTFSDCSSLTSIEIPDSVTSLDGTFSYCTSLTSIEIPDSVISLNGTFSGCSSLTSIEIPDSVTSLDGTFFNCSSLKSIEIPHGVTSLDSTFDGCSSLTSIEIPDSVTSIGDHTFSDCSSLMSIEIPAGVTSIGEFAFSRCDALKSVYITDPNAWCKISFKNIDSIPLGEDKSARLYILDADGNEVRDVVLDNSVTTIPNFAFCNANLTSITIPKVATAIGECAFFRCESMTSIIIPKGIKSIGRCAFTLCSALEGIYFEGDAHGMSYSMLEGTNTTAYYPAGNPTWTQEVMQNYGIFITWIPWSPVPTCHVYDDKVDGTCNICGVDRATVTYRKKHNMLRMYNPYTYEHFYTGSEQERDDLVAAGWKYEGIAFTFPSNTGAPVHRLYDPATGEHLYTMDEAEKADLMAKGWNYEGVAFNSAYDTEAVQHRLHNPYETVGSYHFTYSEEEMQNLINAGWIYQGIGWYSCFK